MKSDAVCWLVKTSWNNILEKCNTNIKVVVVLSCHSELIGNIFFNAGINHVIWIREKEKVADEAWIVFAKAFYKVLFSSNPESVCRAFEAAKAAVQLQSGSKYRRGEDYKFILKTNHTTQQWVKDNLRLKLGQCNNISANPKIWILPAEVPNFVGRTQDCKDIIQKLETKRLVFIQGAAGIGKSALAKQICRLIHERAIFEDGILYMSIKDCQWVESLFRRMYLLMTTTFSNSTSFERFSEGEVFDTEKAYLECLSSVRYLKILIVLDNWDDILTRDYLSFKELLQDFFEKAPKVKIMITSKLELTLVQNIDDYVHFLKKLSDNAVLELLGKKAPSQNEHKRELKELYNTTDVAVAIDDKKLESARHPLFEMLNGHPLSILLMSSLRNGKYHPLNIY